MARHAAGAIVLAVSLVVFSKESHSATQDYSSLSLEQLMNIEITSAAKRPVSILDTPAAAFVLTNDDIRRSGARSVPEALRMVPGLDVAQVSANSWAVSSRGFNGRFANKLQVLVDGRSLYTPLFSGVLWDQQDILLDDIDRIEVIRGPGASLWGANAVNGVINIITKNAADTQGGYASGTIGTNDEGRSEFRYGGTFGDQGHYRVFGKAFTEGDRTETDGTDGADDWRSGSGGFRADFTDPGGDVWFLQGGTFRNTLGGSFVIPTLTSPYSQRDESDLIHNGTYVLGSWTRDLAANNRLEVRSYVQHNTLTDPRISEERTTADLELEHHLLVAGRHNIVWGIGGRYSADDLQDSDVFSIEPDSDQQYLVNGFVQNTVGFWQNAVEFTVGTKLEYNNYTGLEVQPTARALWHVTDRHTAWVSVSRAVRTPSRAENDVDLSFAVAPPSTASGLPTEVRLLGDHSVVSEELLAFEAGHRWQVNDKMSFDLSAFYNLYDRLSSTKADSAYLSSSGGTLHVVQPYMITNNDEADVYGFELVGNWQIQPNARLQGWYALLQEKHYAGANPNHQAAVRLQMNLSPTVTLDANARYVSELDSSDVDGYAELGLRLAWRPQPGLEFAIAGQNLLHQRHLEFRTDEDISGLGLATQVERSIYGTATLRF